MNNYYRQIPGGEERLLLRGICGEQLADVPRSEHSALLVAVSVSSSGDGVLFVNDDHAANDFILSNEVRKISPIVLVTTLLLSFYWCDCFFSNFYQHCHSVDLLTCRPCEMLGAMSNAGFAGGYCCLFSPLALPSFSRFVLLGP